jgi:c-di-GMP-binding flagellar brake protein YcgR
MDDEKTDFKVKLGDSIQLQYIPEGGRERINARVIGHAPGKSLIISAPNTSHGLPLLREGQYFVIRMLQGSTIYGFESSVLKSYTLPYSHVHLSQPHSVESIVVRESRRVNTQNVVSVRKADSKQPTTAAMLNTSVSGALLQADAALGQLGDTLDISAELSVAGFQKYIRITGMIRNISTPADRETQPDDKQDMDNLYRYGVEFVNMDEQKQLIIHGYVYEQIVQQIDS